jgi:plasmid stability protein
MAQVIVRNIDEDIKENLKRMAIHRQSWVHVLRRALRG